MTVSRPAVASAALTMGALAVAHWVWQKRRRQQSSSIAEIAQELLCFWAEGTAIRCGGQPAWPEAGIRSKDGWHVMQRS